MEFGTIDNNIKSGKDIIFQVINESKSPPRHQGKESLPHRKWLAPDFLGSKSISPTYHVMSLGGYHAITGLGHLESRTQGLQ